MKTFEKWINEEASDFLNKKRDNSGSRRITESVYTVQPKSKEELRKIIYDTIKKEGLNCDLNFIDTSLITDMSSLFAYTMFNGKIDKWDVSNVKYMDFMFEDSEFNQNISKWDVSNVEMMRFMFYNSKFDRDLSNWDVSKVRFMSHMFDGSPLESNSPAWYKGINIHNK